MDELNLYDDLDEFQDQQDKKSKELQDLEHKYQESIKTIETLQAENTTLNKKIKRIELNFQSLLDTARAEINRKNKEIEQLRKENDDICFRRRLPHKTIKESHNPKLDDFTELKEQTSNSFKGQDKNYPDHVVTKAIQDKTKQESHKVHEIGSVKRTRSQDREHLSDHKRIKKNADDQYSSYTYEQRKNRHVDQDKMSSRHEYSRNRSHERRNHESPEKYKKTEYAYSSKNYDEHQRHLNRNHSREEHKKYKNPNRNQITKHSNSSETLNRHSRHLSRSHSRERYNFKSREDNKYSKTISKSPSPRNSSDGQHHDKIKKDDNITATKNHKEYVRDLGEEKLDSETLIENHISTAPKRLGNLKMISEDIKKGIKYEEKTNTAIKEVQNFIKTSINDNQTETVFPKESPLKQDTNVLPRNKCANANVFDTNHENQDQELLFKAGDINKLCTPGKLALLNEIFGQTPSTTSSTKSLLNNAKDPLTYSTPPTVVISSATTSPGNYTDENSSNAVPKGMYSSDISSEAKDQHDIDRVENEINECFIRNENFKREKTIASVDMTKIIEDDIANEIHYLQIPGLDLYNLHTKRKDEIKKTNSNVFDLVETHISNSNEHHKTKTEHKGCQNDKQNLNTDTSDRNQSKFIENQENEQKNKSSKSNLTPLFETLTYSKNEEINTTKSVRCVDSPLLNDYKTNIDSSQVSNAGDVVKDKTNIIEIKENVSHTISNCPKDYLTGSQSIPSITSNNSQDGMLESSNMENSLSNCTKIAGESAQCIAYEELEKLMENNVIITTNNDKSGRLKNISFKNASDAILNKQEIPTFENGLYRTKNYHLEYDTELRSMANKTNTSTGIQCLLNHQDFCEGIAESAVATKVKKLKENSKLLGQVSPKVGEEAINEVLYESEIFHHLSDNSINDLNNDIQGAMKTSNIFKNNGKETATLDDCISESNKNTDLCSNSSESKKSALEKEISNNFEVKSKTKSSSCVHLQTRIQNNELENLILKEDSTLKTSNRNSELRNETINSSHIEIGAVHNKDTETNKTLTEPVTSKNLLYLTQSQDSLDSNENNQLPSCEIPKRPHNIKEIVVKHISNDIKTVKTHTLETFEQNKNRNMHDENVIDVEETASKSNVEQILSKEQSKTHLENFSLLISSSNNDVNENQQTYSIIKNKLTASIDLHKITPEPGDTHTNVEETFKTGLTASSNNELEREGFSSIEDTTAEAKSEIRKPEASISIARDIKNPKKENAEQMFNASFTLVASKTVDSNNEIRKLETSISNYGGIKNPKEKNAKQVHNESFSLVKDNKIDTNNEIRKLEFSISNSVDVKNSESNQKPISEKKNTEKMLNESKTQININKISPSDVILNNLTQKTDQKLSLEVKSTKKVSSPQKINKAVQEINLNAESCQQCSKEEEYNNKLIASKKSEKLKNHDDPQNAELRTTLNQEPITSSTTNIDKIETGRETDTSNPFLTNKADEFQTIKENIDISTSSTNISNKAVSSINVDDKINENNPFVSKETPGDLKSSFSTLEPEQQKVEDLIPKKYYQELYDSKKNMTNLLTAIPDSYNNSLIPLPSISTNSPTPSNFSGIFSKRSSFLQNPTEDDFHKFKRKSLHFSTKPREYILPAVSVLCNMDNLENATKLNKKLHWELLDNKHELTEIEDDTDINTTDEELQKNEIKQKQTSPNSSYLDKEQAEQNNQKYKKDDRVNTKNNGGIKYQRKRTSKIQTAKHRKYKIGKSLKAKLKTVRMKKIDLLQDRKPFSVVLPRTQRGRPRKLDNLCKTRACSKKTQTSILKKRGYKPKKTIVSNNNNSDSQKCAILNIDLIRREENVERACVLNSDQNEDNAENCVEEVYQDERQPNEIINEINHNTNAVNTVTDSLNAKDDIEQKSVETIYTKNLEYGTNLQTISNNLELNEIQKIIKDSKKGQKSSDIPTKENFLTDHSKLTKYGIVKLSSNEENNNSAAESSQTNASKTEKELSTEFMSDNTIFESNKAISSLKDSNKNYNEVSATSADSEEKLLIVSDGGQETSGKQTQDFHKEITVKLKSPEKPTKNKNRKSKLNREPQKYISLENIGIKVRPFKGHLSSYRIPKLNRDIDQTCNNSWKLGLDKQGVEEKLKEDKQGIEKKTIQTENEVMAIYSSHKGSLLSYRIPKIKKDNADHNKHNSIKKLETKEEKQSKVKSTDSKAGNQNKETAPNKKDREKISFDAANAVHRESLEETKKLDRAVVKDQATSKIYIDDKTKINKRKLLNPNMYNNQRDSDNDKTPTKSSGESKETISEKCESHEVLEIKHRRNSLNSRHYVLDSSSDEGGISQKTKHLKCLHSVRSQRSSCDENEKDCKTVEALKMAEKIKTLDSTTYPSQYRQNDMKKTIIEESSKLEVLAKAIKARRKSMLVESLVSNEIFESKNVTDCHEIDANLSLGNNIKTANFIKPRRKSMFAELIPAEASESPEGFDNELHLNDVQLHSSGSSKTTAIDVPNISLDIKDHKTSDLKMTTFIKNRRKSMCTESISEAAVDVIKGSFDTPDKEKFADNQTKICEKAIIVETKSMYESTTEEIILEKIETIQSKTNYDFSNEIESKNLNIEATDSSEPLRNVKDKKEINTYLTIEQNSKKDIHDTMHCIEADSDSSVILTQQKSISIRRKSTNQKRKLDSSSEDNEQHIGEQCVMAAKREIQTPLKVVEARKKSRKRRVVKVLSTSYDAQNISTNSSLQSENLTQQSPVVSPLLNHSIFSREVSIQSNEFVASIHLTSVQQGDTKFNEIDSKLHAIFQSPQYITDCETHHASSVDLNNSSRNLSIASQRDSECNNITIEETLDENKEHEQSYTTIEQLNEPNSNTTTAAHNCSEIKHLSLGSAEYRFEKVSDNIVNLFISRKRKRKYKN